jgi:hypothetical protein
MVHSPFPVRAHATAWRLSPLGLVCFSSPVSVCGCWRRWRSFRGRRRRLGGCLRLWAVARPALLLVACVRLWVLASLVFVSRPSSSFGRVASFVGGRSSRVVVPHSRSIVAHVSMRWVGKKVGRGCLPMFKNDKRRISIVVRHLVATSLWRHGTWILH